MKRRLVSGLLMTMVAITSSAASCPVCYGQTDTNSASAVNASVIALLIITGAVLSMFGSFIIYLRKRMRLAGGTISVNSQQIERKERQ